MAGLLRSQHVIALVEAGHEGVPMGRERETDERDDDEHSEVQERKAGLGEDGEFRHG